MSENKAIPPVSPTISEDIVISPAVAAIIERANTGSTEIIEQFASDERNLFRYYLRKVNANITGILGMQSLNPEDFSKVIELKKWFKKLEAANDSHFEEKDAA